MSPQAIEIFASDIINFWFFENYKPLWFAKDQAFDELVANKFKDAYTSVVAEPYDAWKETLAKVLALISFPHRNEILNRKSTPAEIAFLLKSHSSF